MSAQWKHHGHRRTFQLIISTFSAYFLLSFLGRAGLPLNRPGKIMATPCLPSLTLARAVRLWPGWLLILAVWSFVGVEERSEGAVVCLAHLGLEG